MRHGSSALDISAARKEIAAGEVIDNGEGVSAEHRTQIFDSSSRPAATAAEPGWVLRSFALCSTPTAARSGWSNPNREPLRADVPVPTGRCRADGRSPMPAGTTLDGWSDASQVGLHNKASSTDVLTRQLKPLETVQFVLDAAFQVLAPLLARRDPSPFLQQQFAALRSVLRSRAARMFVADQNRQREIAEQTALLRQWLEAIP